MFDISLIWIKLMIVDNVKTNSVPIIYLTVLIPERLKCIITHIRYPVLCWNNWCKILPGCVNTRANNNAISVSFRLWYFNLWTDSNTSFKNSCSSLSAREKSNDDMHVKQSLKSQWSTPTLTWNTRDSSLTNLCEFTEKRNFTHQSKAEEITWLLV